MNKEAAAMQALGRSLARRPSARPASKPLHMLRAYRPHVTEDGATIPVLVCTKVASLSRPREYAKALAAVKDAAEAVPGGSYHIALHSKGAVHNPQPAKQAVQHLRTTLKEQSQ
jgi:hypothetical protein